MDIFGIPVKSVDESSVIGTAAVDTRTKNAGYGCD